MSIKYINNITSSKHSWPDYGAKIKENPTSDTVPFTPKWAPLLIIRKGNIVTLRVLVELPLPASGLIVIYEPQGLSNLAPLRSRLFKLIGKAR